jgi:hypothetical protein
MKKILIAGVAFILLMAITWVGAKHSNATPAYTPMQIMDCNASPIPTCVPWSSTHPLPSYAPGVQHDVTVNVSITPAPTVVQVIPAPSPQVSIQIISYEPWNTSTGATVMHMGNGSTTFYGSTTFQPNTGANIPCPPINIPAGTAVSQYIDSGTSGSFGGDLKYIQSDGK